MTGDSVREWAEEEGEGSGIYQSSCEVDACCSRVGAVHPGWLGETEEPM